MRDIGGDAGALGRDGTLGYLHHNLGTDGVDIRYILAGNLLLLFAGAAFALNLFSDGTMVTKGYDMSFGRTAEEFASPAAYEEAYEKFKSLC